MAAQISRTRDARPESVQGRAPRAFSDRTRFGSQTIAIPFDMMQPGTLLEQPLGVYGMRSFLQHDMAPVVWSDTAPRVHSPSGAPALSNVRSQELRNGRPRGLARPGEDSGLRLTFEVRINRIGFELRGVDATDLNVLVTCMREGEPLGTCFFEVGHTYSFLGVESPTPFDEVRIEFTNPDSVLFSLDNLLHELDLDDADRDGWPDFADVCPRTPNVVQTDSDGDGLGDACDLFPHDRDNDIDGDGLGALIDNCPLVFNPEQDDTDRDGLGDACDLVAGGDADGDGVSDSADNCPDRFNPEQADCDADGIGDLCDPTLIEPAFVDVALPLGGSITVTKTVCLPPAPPLVDVVIAVDVTGSMGGEIQRIRSNIVAFVNNVRQALPFSDIRFGVVAMRDYPGAFSSCDYSAVYSRDSDQPFVVEAPIGTPDIEVLQVLNSLQATGGQDQSEAYGRVLWEMNQPDSGIGFRSGAARFVLMLGDAPPHDCNLGLGMSSCLRTPSTGVDPGRDGLLYTEDDIDFQDDALRALLASHTRMLMVFSGSYGFCAWERWTQTVGGGAVLADETGALPPGVNLAQMLIDLIRDPIVSNVTYAAENPCGLELSFDPPFIPGPIDVTHGARVSFQETIRVPDSLPPGVSRLDCTVRILSQGALIGEQTIHVDIPCREYVLDFETEDDLVTPLRNGQAIAAPAEFGRMLSISSAGPNLGATAFDSTPGGPNDPALNGDMLIGHGNLLLLQDSRRPGQSSPGYFSVPTDDPEGGDLIFSFVAPVDPKSVLLADINPPPNLGASVTLLDGAGRTRVYAIQPGWTGPYGDAGPRRLDLRTNLPQAGAPAGAFLTYARATEAPGFEQANVVKIVVHMTGYGALDELTFCQ